jgi:FMN reductase
LVVGLGGTKRSGSSSERALRFALDAAADAGAEVRCFGGTDLDFPIFVPEMLGEDHEATELIETLAVADGVIVATPGYHGGISGQVKNALDYVEELRDDHRPYFDGRAVGCIVCAHGTHAAFTTLVSLRSVIHALRGWPTPLGVCLNSAVRPEDLIDARAAEQLQAMAGQVVDFATRGALSL